MDASEQIQRFQEFLEENYKDQLLENVRKGNKFLIVDFAKFSMHDPDLADALLDEPEEVLRAGEIAVEQFDLPEEVKDFKIRMKNLPDTQEIMIRNIRSVNLMHLLLIRGVVRQKSDVRPQVTTSKFECPSCGNIISVLQLDSKFKEPSRCGCGRKGKFRQVAKELIDAQGIVLEEAPEDLEGGEQPKRMNVLLKGDLVSPISDRRTNPGAKILVTGVVKEVPIIMRSGAQSTRFDLIIEANYVEPIEEDYSDITISDEEREQIVELSQDARLSDRMVQSVAPTIYGHDKIKYALMLQLLGGVRKARDDGAVTRGDMHILLIGDPGSGKCLHGDTKIIQNDGDIRKIKDIVEDAGNFTDHKSINLTLPSLQLEGRMGKGMSTRVWKRRSPNRLLQLRTRSGKILKVTPNHPLFTMQEGHVIAREAQDYKIGDRIASPRKVHIQGALQFIKEFAPDRQSNNSRPYYYPEIMDTRLARFAGYIAGDGYLAFTDTSGWISLTNNDPDVLQDFMSMTRWMFGARCVIRNGHKGKSAKEAYLLSQGITEFVDKTMPELMGGSAKKSIPRIILRSPDKVLASFISGLFECDSHINLKKKQVEFCTISKEMAENLQISLLRFGIVSFLKKKMKYASNTKRRRKRAAYEIIISGEMVKIYSEHIGFVSKRKRDRLQLLLEETTSYNTNVDLVPGMNRLLRRIRKRNNLTQSEMGIKRTSYAHYEQDNRLPSITTLRKIADHLESKNILDEELRLLSGVAHSDIYWDEIIEIKSIPRDEEAVYDLEVDKTHNYTANGVVVHNSQLLKRVIQVAPKARYVSGKGASGAGLCVSPKSMVMTNPGGMESIQRVVDKDLKTTDEYMPGVWKETRSSYRIQSMDDDLKIQSRSPSAIWKLKAPERVFEITLSSGKKIELTGNTSLFTLSKKTSWTKSMELEEGMLVATPRKLIGGKVTKQPVLDLIRSNPVVHDVKPIVRSAVKKLSAKHGSIRNASRALGIRENQLYHHWVNEEARGNIKLEHLKKICNAADTAYPVRKVSLYNGRTHTLPTYLSKDFLYVAGLIAGDGDIRRSNTTIRLSNSDESLHRYFRETIEKEYSLRCNVTEGDKNRPRSTRFQSKILGEVLGALGIPFSPKSDKLEFSNTLLHLSDEMLAEYIAGLYDASLQLRSRGSDCISICTCSERYARQLQLVLLRFSIHATLRKRPPTTGRIKGKHERWVVEIRSIGQIQKFADIIRLRHPEKRKKLRRICSKDTIGNSNSDLVTGVGGLVKEELQKRNISLKKSRWHENLSRDALQRIVRDAGLKGELRKLAESDIYWEKIVRIEEKKPDYEYVYDLTVEDSHNFVVDGVLVHNTASVVKDEFLSGWSLEAGALVLANKGVCAIDELDKMTIEDRSAMHEALEQQCYDYNTIITFADGSEKKIGEYVEEKMRGNPEKIVKGHDCLILENVDEEVMTTDWESISSTRISRVSKHLNMDALLKIRFSNGRSITVTKEHPVFVIEKSAIITKRADELTGDEFIPVPRHIPISGEEQYFETTSKEIYNSRASQHIKVPEHNDPQLYRIIGYLLSEGSKETNRGKLIGINFCNKDKKLLSDFERCMRAVFDISAYPQVRHPTNPPVVNLRYISRELAEFFVREFPELLNLAPHKTVPAKLMKGRLEDVAQLVLCLFEGDGHVSVKARTLRIGYGTNSPRLAEQVQDLLLRFGIRSSLTEHQAAYKVNVTGYENIRKFREHIGFISHTRAMKVDRYLKDKEKTYRIRTYKDRFKGVEEGVVHLIETYRPDYMSRKNVYDRKTDYLTAGHGISRHYLQKIFTNLESKDIDPADQELYDFLFRLAFGEIGFEKITAIEKVPPKDKWTYDITVEPTHNFISQGAVLHNSVTISKANIQATLRAETTVLAAANPKFGRFDPYETISKQIDLPVTLINRFDLIFPVRDLPDSERDEHMASFILTLHQEPNKEVPEIQTQLLKKYIAYARQNIKPKLTDEAVEEIKQYYVKMRNTGSSDEGVQSIPISARQLEALVRMAEASARMRLAQKVTKKDAKIAIDLVHYCLSQVGVDPETGKIDIDRISTGITSSERGKIVTVREIIGELESAFGKNTPIPVSDIQRESMEKGMSEDKVDEAIEKLKRSGDIFEPKPGFIQKI